MPTRQSGGRAPAPAQHIADCTHPFPVFHPADPFELYVRETRDDGTTKHSRRCKATFGRHDPRCHRCIELQKDALPRESWHHDYLARKLGQLQRKLPF